MDTQVPRRLKTGINRVLGSRLIAYVAVTFMLSLSALQAAEPEDELKAAVVLSFVRYTEWKPSSAPDTVIRVGVTGRPGFREALKRTLEGKTVGNSLIRVIDLETDMDAPRCHVVYFATTKNSEAQHGLSMNRAARAITIGEADQFIDSGGAIAVHLVDGRIRFEVNLMEVQRVGASISSKLLRFGRIRVPAGGGG